MKILFITLSNIGDVIMTLPALDYLKGKFPEARVTVLCGQRAKEIFTDDPAVEECIVYDKHAPFREKFRLYRRLQNKGFDVVADLRNTMFGVLIRAALKTSPFLAIPRGVTHMKDRHLYKVTAMTGEGGDFKNPAPVSFSVSGRDEAHVDAFLKASGIKKEERFAVVSSGARSHVKRWAENGFAEVIGTCVKTFGMKVILAGDASETGISRKVFDAVPSDVKNAVIDASGKTTLAQLAAVLKRSRFLITNDSACLHLASYLDIPVVAVFGPTDDAKYGPWSSVNAIVRKDIFCRPCAKAQCRFGTLECMRLVTAADVVRGVERLEIPRTEYRVSREEKPLKRILITRTDRMGDVVLSAPVIQVLRDAYPTAYIAIMVSPYTADIVRGNPYLDEVIIVDKRKLHRWPAGFLRLVFFLKMKKFDAAFALHPETRVHLALFLSGIPRRIGFDRKAGFLLTDRIPLSKQLGQKHEMEYTFDVVRSMGIEPREPRLYMPLRKESEAWADDFLRKEGISAGERLLAVHPSSSCISRRWPLDRFAEVAERLAKLYSFKVLIIADTPHISIAQDLAGRLQCGVVNAAGKTTVSQMASLLKRCALFISNDSGPVHVAAALGVPVISIFGRNQKGLGPVRWGPIGRKSRYLHKDIGCTECRAHNCVKGFACLHAITVEEVIQTAAEILSRP